MKKIIIFAFGAACTLAAGFAQAQLTSDEISAAQALFANNGCSGCHAASETVVGPALRDIAKRYKGKKVVDELAARIRDGSSGRWGDAVYPAMAALEPEEAKLLARWVLDGAK